jgi:hypothetical protein
MNWLDLSLTIHERIEISKMAVDINQMPPEKRSELFVQLATNQKLQEKAIQQMSAEIFQKELNQIEPRS